MMNTSARWPTSDYKARCWALSMTSTIPSETPKPLFRNVWGLRSHALPPKVPKDESSIDVVEEA
jgi:hypothetical protein